MATAALRAPQAPFDDDAVDPIAADLARPLLRFVTCGSVDDGKSTLIGRLLHDSGQLFDDQIAALASDSGRFGTRGGELDYALLVDGLAAEREQGITIDVAHRYFASARRRYIVADAPGHAQYTRNMVTAASTADLAILLVDATRGPTEQTRRHARIVRLLGVASVLVAVNKMDLIGYDRARFDAIVTEIAALDGIGPIATVPVVAVAGGNVARRSAAMPWYRGPTLLELLEAAPGRPASTDGGFVMPVQWVSRPDAAFRGFAGTIARGTIAVGDAVTVIPGGQDARVARIVTFDGDLAAAVAGRAVTIALDREIECAAGAMLVAADDRPDGGEAIVADLVWFDEAPLATTRAYLMQVGSARVPAHVETVLGRLDDDDGDALAMNGIATVRLRTDTPIAALPYADSRALGAFVLIDPATNATAAAGMIRSLAPAEHQHRRTLPIYAFAEDDPRAAATVARLRAVAAPGVLIDRAALYAGVASDVAADDHATLWRRALAVATLCAEAGVTVALAIDPPAGFAPVGQAWPDDDGGPDWVI